MTRPRIATPPPSTLGLLASIAIVLAVAAATRPALRAQELYTDPGDASVSGEVDRIYVRGLRYLAARQTTLGTWPEPPYGHEPAVVGLAMVSFLAHGDDPNAGPFQQTLRRGYEFILSQQATGSGYIGRSMYNHGFATLALAEAYGTLDDPRLGPALRKAVDLILSSQAKNPFGAWRYGPDSTDADTTVSGAQMVALFAARNAGIAVPEDAIQKGLKYYYTSQNPDGGFCYTHGTASNGPRTAIGCLVLALAREKNTKAFQNAFGYLQKAPGESSYQQYFLYYAAQAFFHASPEAWSTWNRTNIKSLAASQTSEGSWEGTFGPTFGTAASLLSLALNYRYLPIYER
jgi:hypothetical protein